MSDERGLTTNQRLLMHVQAMREAGSAPTPDVLAERLGLTVDDVMMRLIYLSRRGELQRPVGVVFETREEVTA